MNTLGHKIKEIRKAKGLTQNDLAEIVGVSVHAIAKYEQGQREPNLKILTKIIDELDLDFWEVSPSMNIEIEAAKPYEEGIKFADEVCYRVTRKKYAQEWITESSKEEVLDMFLSDNKDLDIHHTLREIEKREYIKKFGELNEEDEYSFKEYSYFFDVRNKIYKDIRDAILFTIELKLKEADKVITQHCEDK